MPAVRPTHAFKRQYKKKPQADRDRIDRCLTLLAYDPSYPGLHTHKIQGLSETVFEAYVDNANRVTFHWEGEEIVLRRNCNHDLVRSKHA